MPKTRHAPVRPASTAQLLTSGSRIDWHRHEADQVVMPLSGVVAFMTDAGTWMVPAPGRAAWIPADTPHAHLAHRRTELRSVQLSPGRGPRFASPTILAVDPLFRALVVTLADDAPADRAEHGRLMAVLRDRVVRREQRPLHLPEPRDDRLAALARLLAADPGDRRGLDALGPLVGASGRTLSRLCRDELGLTFPFWRTQIRLGHALVLLAEGSSVTRAAHACGWSSASAFIAVFRDFFGTTPSAYQRGLT
ncbi:MAG: helix-turn-helix transcriptional regulator [Streptosporangiales bacterium]|nr:helix-turn-helix transcriptional regulator [Streptosporangiales bacterium]MBO0890798.1 helix-turn-helix transcriptional regulator [Acidothermales bacterium]